MICSVLHSWLCVEATGLEHTWNSISGHTCGRYKESHLKSKVSVEDYQRFTQYYRRCKAHIYSLRIEAFESKQKILDKVHCLEENQLKDFSWAMNGLTDSPVPIHLHTVTITRFL